MITRLTTCPSCGHVLTPTYGPPAPPPPAPPHPAPPHPAPPHPAPVAAYGPVYPASPPAPRVRPTAVRTASVPKILLGLGATCLLVAAVIFLAVAWSWLGVGGRTGVLVGLTLASGAAGQWCGRRGLPVAAEALTTVSLGLVVLDLVGAEGAGWLGTPSPAAFVSIVGSVLLLASLGLCVVRDRRVVPQLAAPAGLGLLAVGTAWQTEHVQVTAAGAVLAMALLAAVGRRLGARVLPWSAAGGAFASWSLLGLIALVDALTDPSLHALWVDGHGWGLVGASALALLGVAIAPEKLALRQTVVAFAASTLTFVAAVPALDEGPTGVALAALAATVVWSVLAAATPPRWYAAPRVPLLGSALVLAAVPAELAGQALVALANVGTPFTAAVDVRLDPAPHLAAATVLPLGVAGLALAAILALPRTRLVVEASGAALAVAGVLTAALFPAPLWPFVAALALAAGVLLAVALQRRDRDGVLPAGAGAVVALVALVLALPSAVLTTVVLAAIVMGAGAVLASRFREIEPITGLVLPLALAGLIWSAGEVADVTRTHRSLAVLVVLGLLALALPRVEVEVAAWAASLSALALGVPLAADVSVTLAVDLTLAGVLVCASALVHPDRRLLGWAGGALLAAATWVRLADVGVVAPEPYTLPSAIALLLLGLDRLRRDPRTETATALGPALTLATVPSLLWALVDPVSPRAAFLGGACLVLVVAGAQLRWGAPLLVGAFVGGVLVLRELAPYAAQTPQWVLIGLAGAVLISVGVTWESRVRDLQHAAGHLGRLR